MSFVVQRISKKMGTEWSVEETEVALPQDRSVLKYLFGQAACTKLHEGDKVSWLEITY